MTQTSTITARCVGRISRLRTAALGAGLAAAVAMAIVPIVSAAQPGTVAPTAPSANQATLQLCLVERADARDKPSIETLRALGDCEIQRRYDTLDRLDAVVAGAPAITDEHKQELRFVNDTNPTSFQATRSGLDALKGKIDAETDLAALRTEVGQIATDFRVYLLVAPKTHLVRGADAGQAVVDRFGSVHDELQALIDRAKAAGKDTTAAAAALASMDSKVSRAEALVQPLAGQLLPLTVAQYNDGTAGPKLISARTALGQARDLLTGARADARQVITLLKG